MALELMAGAGEIAFGFAGEVAVFGGLFRVRFFVPDFSQDVVGRPILCRAGIESLLDGQGFFGEVRSSASSVTSSKPGRFNKSTVLVV